MKEIIIPEGAPKPLAPYSPAIRLKGHLVFTSGQIALDPTTGKMVAGGIEAQTRKALENLIQVLEAGGADATTVVKTTVFLANMDDYGTVNSIYGEYFSESPPARSAVQVARLPLDALVEIEAIAYVK